ncbi:quinone-dependent dihydroorotate dehydrogenase [Rhodospirillum rubrum]|uniref:Dihydroorotate dehydrogenase (quinone) n=1 Tax=Rhodospirillum rubrum (strain ATCC 11170 / ATH 1.1.1 / DSM 467 / LMG 4362 / NCIMB 8255 / S1) TaxID=269796 RepID=PYRD_RHORT|nr:quinone-dependent dihydroorotate dehydrogenase [Rhodospirillum rubrum]Q2RX27.1 RecName: Full=Dihydroorotate dehydrogenase (quinone); AltName: Full=DHOdehase; Short=DHOD; Short=DHODase; AltName: Full=Dihydroorotate oxidase [Rhodospirillum rubrum ATCC 11170]ABC21318.1 dihydroorotate oxidase A [Rhodospirillum rubrum ATCC 11170]AEO46998.1 dihydroorotate dehydrogenase 2 [Rhodospirillum rubrum F11]MBK5952906.1 dihydroorotate dehydrogenase (quinone) [Rhodospirillum rubrum]QXG81000.1 quinone-depend
MADWYRLAWPLICGLDPERAHHLAIRALALGLAGHDRAADDPVLACSLWGRRFANPLGLAAGFDKNGEVADALFDLGFGFVEVGTVTPRPQAGNPRPRLFRLTQDRAVINRMGFNNQGMEAMAARFVRARPRGVLGINLGKNKTTEDAAGDYEAGIAKLAPLADYLVINVSSPNTPGLRALQGREPLSLLIARARAALDAACPGLRPPLLLKVAPDLTDEDMADIAEVALGGGLDGLICTNTTIARPKSLVSDHAGETGGLSGLPLRYRARQVIARLYGLTKGALPLIGVGGIGDGAEAYARIRAGASLIQIYSALVYEGPGLVGRIKRDLAQRLRADGFASVAEAVGADHRDPKGASGKLAPRSPL